MLDHLWVKPVKRVLLCTVASTTVDTSATQAIGTKGARITLPAPILRLLLLTMCDYCYFEADATARSIKRSNVRTAMPVGPFAR